MDWLRSSLEPSGRVRNATARPDFWPKTKKRVRGAPGVRPPGKAPPPRFEKCGYVSAVPDPDSGIVRCPCQPRARRFGLSQGPP